MPYCFFKISRIPILVISFPCTAFLNSFMSSGGRKRFGPLGGFIFPEESVLASFEGEESFAFCRLIGLRGIRGGSKRVPCGLVDACRELLEVADSQ